MMRLRNHALSTLPLLVVGSALVPADGTAQDPDRERRERTCVCQDFGGDAFRRLTMAHGDRAQLGIVIGEEAQVGDRPGVRVDDVSAGAPAERAGLRAGDVIVALDGQDLGAGPDRALVDYMRGVEPGDTVEVRYHRDGRFATARVVTGRMPGFAFSTGDLPMVLRRDGPGFSRVRPGARFELAPSLWFGTSGLELADVNPQLGSYFGVDAGVLVVEVPDDSRLGLRPGDVIVRIGDRDVLDADHVRSILASYRDGEEVTMEVMRDRRRTTVRGQAPE